MLRQAIAAAAILLAAGCGGGEEAPPTASVSGKVTFQGAPVTEGFVNFASDAGFAASAPLQEDGAYELVTQYGDMPTGPYKVSVTPPSPPDTGMGDATAEAPPMPDPENIPKKYREYGTSGLTVEVTEDGANTFDFDLQP